MKQITLSTMDSVKESLTPLQEALDHCRKVFSVIFAYSFVINITMLLTSIYALQVLDRVVGSGSLETLFMLFLIFAFIYVIHGLMQISRTFILTRLANWLDRKLSPLLLSYSIVSSSQKQTLGGSDTLREFQNIKGFLTSPAFNSILDAPWSVAYIAAIFMINHYIGYLTVVGMVIVISLAFFNAYFVRGGLNRASEYTKRSMHQAEIATRNAETVEAMGMMRNVSRVWRYFNVRALEEQSVSSFRNGFISNSVRFLRNIMQMLVTGIGAYIVVSSQGQDMGTGGMIACSILVGKALAPFDNAIEVWKQITNSLKSYHAINQLMTKQSVRDKAMPLPNIEGHLTADNVYYAAPQEDSEKELGIQPTYILKGISFSADPGEVIAVLGPSGSGKTSLAKILVGVRRVNSGTVRLDGGEIYRWNREDFGKKVGYLPQGIELFNGTIAANISRLEEKIDMEKVEAAAKLAGAHDIISAFPNGYETDIGVGGASLSGGQKQRVALARAFYGNPKILILDEPNANLDEAGEKSLSNALLDAKKQGMTTLVISHRPSVLGVVDKIIIMQKGLIVAQGSKTDILSRLSSTKDGMIHFND